MTSRILFVGVTTAASSAMKAFPKWAKALGLKLQLEGRDLPLDAPPHRYRELVRDMQENVSVLGAVVTSHKVDLFLHASDLFERLDDLASLCGEVGCVSREGVGLVGHAIDPISVGHALDELVAPEYWRTSDAEVLCLGTGGSGLALLVQLLMRAHSPAGATFTDTRAEQLKRVRLIQQRMSGTMNVRTVHVRVPTDNDGALLQMPPGSLVVNATGLGKDRPGSPLSDDAVFPERSVVWDLNYRGDLRFLEQARAQPALLELRIVDGSDLFLHGWAEGLSRILSRRISAEALRAVMPS